LCFLAFSSAVLAVGEFEMRLELRPSELLLLYLSYRLPAAIYAIRSRRRFFGLRPSIWMILSPGRCSHHLHVAVRGIAMAPLPFKVVACEFAAAIAFGIAIAAAKVPLLARLELS